MLGVFKHASVTSDVAPAVLLAGVQIGQAIISPETAWDSTASIPVYSLVPVGTAFSGIDYPVLATKYPSLVTPTLAQEDGSAFPYVIVADLQELDR